MTKVYICQCLCPKRHAIVSYAAELGANDFNAETLSQIVEGIVDEMVHSYMLNPACPLCGAPRKDWKCETAPSIYQTMAEAQGPLREMQEKQLQQRKTAKFIHASRN